MKRLAGLAKLLGFLALTLPLMPIQALFKTTAPGLARRFPHLYHRVLCRILGVRVMAVGELPVSPCLIVANHVSWLDIPAVSAALPVSFIARHDIGTWPLFGQMAKLQRTIFVDRSRRSTTGDVRDEIVKRLSAGDMLVLFPEGTSHDGINVLPFKSPFFASVEAAGVPIVPATLAYCRRGGLPMTRREMPRVAWYGDMDMVQHLWGFVQDGSLDVTIQFHPSLQGSDRKVLARESENVVRGALGPLLR